MTLREPAHDDVVPADRATRHRRRHRRSKLLQLLVALVVAGMVAGAFWLGAQTAPKPVAPTASQVVQTKCTINTEAVRKAAEHQRDLVNQRRNGKLTEAKFEDAVAGSIPKLAEAVRQQTVSCKQA